MLRKLLWTVATVGVILGGIAEAKIYHESTDAYIRNRVVMLTGNQRQCSGIQVKSLKFGYIYILTAAHCSLLLENNKLTAHNEGGEKKLVQLIAIDRKSDLMLLTPMDGKYIEIAENTKLHQKIRTITHGAGHSTYTTYGELLEDAKLTAPLFMIDEQHLASSCPKDAIHKVETIPAIFDIPMLACVMEVHETMSDAPTVGGSSGGAVVDNYGHLVGIVSMGDYLGFSGFVRFSDIKTFLQRF